MVSYILCGVLCVKISSCDYKPMVAVPLGLWPDLVEVFNHSTNRRQGGIEVGCTCNQHVMC